MAAQVILPLGQLRKNNLRKIVIIFLSISLTMCFGCSKETSHQDGSFEYPQHMVWLRNKKIIFSYSLLSGDLTFCNYSKILNTFLFQILFSYKMLIIWAGTHKVLVRKANREDPDQTASSDAL